MCLLKRSKWWLDPVHYLFSLLWKILRPRRIFRYWRKTSLLAPIICLGEFALGLIWVETQAGPRSSVLCVRSRAFLPWQWNICYTGCPAVPPAERAPHWAPGQGRNKSTTRSPAAWYNSWFGVSFWSFRVLGDVLSLVGVFLSSRFGLGICPGFCPRCWWHHLFSACCGWCLFFISFLNLCSCAFHGVMRKCW